MGELIDEGLWRLLWMPPTLPYWPLEGPFEGKEQATKRLLFSAWNMVPDVVSAVLSYEAERLMMGGRLESYENPDREQRPLLRLTQSAAGVRSRHRLLLLLLPCLPLADRAHPLDAPAGEDRRAWVRARVDELLADPGLPNPQGGSVVVALDWTSFAADGQDTIVLSMVTGHGRATPLLWKTVASSTLKGNQRRYEYEVLRRLREVLPAGVKVTVLADRGFGDCKLFYALTTELAFEYVIRLRGDIYVTSAGGERRAAAAWVGAGGRARRLVGARVTDTYELPVGVVVCVHDPKMDEPWCLVASDATVPTRVLIRYYGKRWGIEAGFRDIKDMRFGMGLSSMHVSRPDRRDRLLLISALAIAVLSLLGAAGERIGYDRWLKANTVKRRTHSLFRQGLMLYHHLPNWPEDRIRPLMETFGSMLMEQRAYREVFGVI